MMNFNSLGVYSYGHLLHMFFCLLILLAIVLIVVWAIRFAKKEEVKKLITILLIIGVLGSFLTAALGGFSGWSMHGWNTMEQMMGIEE
jgi:hypothetical protein